MIPTPLNFLEFCPTHLGLPCRRHWKWLSNQPCLTNREKFPIDLCRSSCLHWPEELSMISTWPCPTLQLPVSNYLKTAGLW